MSRRHLQMKVSTVLDMLETEEGQEQLVNMFQVPPEDMFLECEQLTAEGKIYLLTEGCDNTDSFGKCLGHPGQTK